MNELPLRDYLAMQIMIHEINSGKDLSDHDINTLTHVAMMRANTIIENRFQYLDSELTAREQEMDAKEQYAFAENQREQLSKALTPARIHQIQKEREEVEEWNRNNPHMPRRQYIPKM